MPNHDLDERLRSSALAFLRLLVLQTGERSSDQQLAQFEFQGERIPLMDRQRGIRKPRHLDAAFSFRTVFSARPDQRPYADEEARMTDTSATSGVAFDPQHAENRALRRGSASGD